MKLDLPQYNDADKAVRDPYDYQYPNFNDLSDTEVKTVLLQLLEAMGLQVRRVNGQLVLDKKD